MSDSKKTPSSSDIQMDSSAESLQSIIDQKKKVMNQAIQESETKTKKRHLRLIKALIRIRNSLRGIERIDMGERFRLQLVLDDLEGWPRMILKTIDTKNPTNEHEFLVISSHDRQDSGSIVFKSSFEKKAATIALSDPNNLTKLSIQVKKQLRDYLNFIGDKVVEIEQEEASQRKTFYEEEEKKKEPAKKLNRSDESSIALSLD